MAAAALMVLGLVLAIFGIVSWLFRNADASPLLVGLGILALIAAGVLQVMMSRRA